jgi:phage virion morphogenesis protein
MFSVRIEEDEITGALDSLLLHLGDMTPVMQEIGELLMASTKDRFQEGTAPDGIKWATKSPNTKGRDRRPLFGPSGMLSSQIFYQAGADQVEIGSNRVYAAMMQFGGTKAQFPHLWGDIPARPFLGVSEEDRAGILATVEEWLEVAAQGGASSPPVGD